MVDLTLKWEKFGLSRGLHEMMGSGELVDVTIMCQGEVIQAHRNVLAACSEQFRHIFKAATNKHPFVFLKGINLKHLKSIFEFMYLGEVTVSQSELSDFLSTADDLGITALSKKSENDTTRAPPKRRKSKINYSKGAAVYQSQEQPSSQKITEKMVSSHPMSQKPKEKVNCVSPVEPRELPISDSDGIQDLIVKQEIFESDEGDAEEWIEPQDETLDEEEGDVDCEQSMEYESSPQPDASTSQERKITESPVYPVPRPVRRYKSSRTNISEEASVSDNNSSCLNNDLFNVSASGIEFDHRQFKCDKCYIQLPSYPAFLDHMTSAHDAEIRGVEICDVCNKTFKNRQSLYCHRSAYHIGVKERHICDTCGASFGLKHHLKRHVRNFHGDLAVPHECEICNKVFKNQNAYESHVNQTHRKKKKKVQKLI